MGDPEVFDKEIPRRGGAYLTKSQFAAATRAAGIDVSDHDVAELLL